MNSIFFPNTSRNEETAMENDLNRQISDAKERLYLLNKAERKRTELTQRVFDQEHLIIKLEIELESEQADVDKLSKLSLTNLFHTILRSKKDQMDYERQQVLNVVLQLQAAQQALEATRADLVRVGDDLTANGDAERAYKKLMSLKESSLRSGSKYSTTLSTMEKELDDQAILVKELLEAWTAGKRVVASLDDASASLEKAENWGKWDLLGGGMLTTHQKHSHVDDAKASIQNANHLMLNFQEELKDLNRGLNIQIDISGTLKMADYWFDGLITDWVVQGRIANSQSQTLKALSEVRAVVNRLQAEHATASSALSVMRSKRTSWIEETRTD
jgi:hypothetical protein